MAAESAAGIDARVSRLLPLAAAGPCAWVCFSSARPQVRAPLLRSWTRLAAWAEPARLDRNACHQQAQPVAIRFVSRHDADDAALEHHRDPV